MHVAVAIDVSAVETAFERMRKHPGSLNPVALFQAAAAEKLSPMHFTWALVGNKNKQTKIYEGKKKH